MKAKLIKNHYGYTYFLADENGDGIATSDNGNLSKENCDEIFGVVDVEKLAYDYSWTVQSVPEYGTTMAAYKEGFNKAMELNKDKVFTLEDMNNAMDWIMTQYFEFHEQPTTGRREQYLESLQQPTEIEVEIICLHTGDPKYTTNTGIPKLDSEGQLILKKI